MHPCWIKLFIFVNHTDPKHSNSSVYLNNWNETCIHPQVVPNEKKFSTSGTKIMA